MKADDQAKHLIASLAYEVKYLREEVECSSKRLPARRYVSAGLDDILHWCGYPKAPVEPGTPQPGWDPPELDPEDEGPVWTVLFERKYLGEPGARADLLDTRPVLKGHELVSKISLSFPISVVEWVKLTPQRAPLDKTDIVRQAESFLEELDDVDLPPRPEDESP